MALLNPARPDRAEAAEAMTSDPPSPPGADIGRKWHLLAAVAPPLLLALFWRTWQQLFAFDRGLDATMPGFGKYWLTIFAFNLLVVPAVFTAWFGWIVLTAAKARHAALSPEVETRRIWRLWLIIAAFAMAAFWGGSRFAEQDAAWHQVTMRDTAFTPSHIALFYGAFPLMLYFSFGAFLYARTRLPHLFGTGKAFPVSFALVVGGSVLLLFQVAFNEFGHTFWETEEIFSAPLHWPFVFFAYLLFGTFGVWFRTLPRIFELAAAHTEKPGRTEVTA